MPVFIPIAPESIVETLDFYTDIRPTFDGEWRDNMKEPSYLLAFAWKLPDRVATILENIFEETTDERYQVPLWQDHEIVTGGLTNGQTVIPVDTTVADYQDGLQIAIIQDEYTYEVATILSSTAANVTLSSGLTQDYPGEVILAPVVEGLAPAGLSRDEADEHSELSAQFICHQARTRDIAATTFPTFGLYEVLTDSSVLVKKLNGDIVKQLGVIDDKLGGFDVVENENYWRKMQTIAFFDITPAQRFGHRQWFHHLAGRDRPFWLPTWKRDLQMTGTLLAAGTQLFVERTFVAPASYIGRSIQIQLADGTLIHREITDAALVSGQNEMELTIAAPGFDVPASSLVSWMTLTRLNSDKIKTSHVQGGLEVHSTTTVQTKEVNG